MSDAEEGRKCWHPKEARHDVIYGEVTVGIAGAAPSKTCGLCGHNFYAAVSRRSRNNGKRGRRAELTIAREIPGARKMGPLGLPWDVEVGEYARLQVKKLVSRPSANAIRKLIEAIPNTGDRLRGFVWVEAAGKGKRGRREVTFLSGEFDQWHGGLSAGDLLTMPLEEWVAEFVA